MKVAGIGGINAFQVNLTHGTTHPASKPGAFLIARWL